jgi:hypothetical protein
MYGIWLLLAESRGAVGASLPVEGAREDICPGLPPLV